jgi:hypothetical protein
MSKARRSVGPEIIQQYDEFSAKIKQDWGNRDGQGGEGTSLYDIDVAAAEQAREDTLLDAETDDFPDEPVQVTE